MRLVIASNNAHKVAEIKAILADRFAEILSQSEAGIDVEIEEDGDTFEANAVKKAAGIQEYLPDCAVLADDSGLEVYALHGAPGVHSARFAGGQSCHGEGSADIANNEKLLNLLQGVPERERGCRFVSCVALARPEKHMLTAAGCCEGVVGIEPTGEGGFGYDPLFYIPELGKTYSELSPEEKNAVSHRRRALEALCGLLDAEG